MHRAGDARARRSPPPISCAMSMRAASTARNSTGRCGPGAGPGLIQGGVRDRAQLFPPIAHEPTVADRPHPCRRRALGAAPRARHGAGRLHDHGRRPAPISTPGPIRRGDRLGYAVFGRVVEGMDVVRRILAAPTSPTEGEGAMRGQMLSPAHPHRHRARALPLGRRARSPRSPRRRRGGCRRRSRNRRRAASAARPPRARRPRGRSAGCGARCAPPPAPSRGRPRGRAPDGGRGSPRARRASMSIQWAMKWPSPWSASSNWPVSAAAQPPQKPWPITTSSSTSSWVTANSSAAETP